MNAIRFKSLSPSPLARTPFARMLAGVARAALLPGLIVLAALATDAGSAQANTGPHLRIAGSELGRTQHVQVGINKSLIVDLPVEAGEVIVSQPGVANAIMRTRSRAVVQGISVGETNIFFLDPNGGGIAVLEISVTQDATGLAATLNRLIPGSRIDVQTFSSNVVLSGHAQSADDVQRAIDIAAQFTGDSSRVASVISVSGGQQVALRVIIAEVTRDAARQFGINLSASLDGGVTTSLVNAPALGGGSGISTGQGTIGVGFSAGNLSIDASLRALERNGAMRMLASPTLTAISGETADFLVGGEFPVQTTGPDGQVATIFREYGVGLTFVPVVRSNGIVALQLETSVTELAGGGLTTRRASTSVELPTGSTLAIAGLIEDRVRQQVNQMPGFGNIPILGALFRSRDFIHSQTELVILVTPTIAQATYAAVPLPTDNVVIATDAETVFLGRMESLYGVGAGGGGPFRGSVGFVLD